MHIFLAIAAIIVGLRILWGILSYFEEKLLEASNYIIMTLTPTGLSLIFSVVIFLFSIKYIRQQTLFLGSSLTNKASIQKMIALPIFIAFIIFSAYIKGVNIDSYTDNVRSFYDKSNKFVKKTSLLEQYRH